MMKKTIKYRYLLVLSGALAALCVALFSCDVDPQSSPPGYFYGSGNGSNIIDSESNQPDAVKPEARVGHEGTWYEIFTWSFADSNGDGKGDLQGIINRLDYLNDTGTTAHQNAVTEHGECNHSLHVKGIWLTPIMTAQLGSTHKYDTIDYMTIDPDFDPEGRGIDLVRDLLAACHERGMELIIDLAVNHTSPEHPWFQSCTAEWRSGRLGTYANYYNIRVTSEDWNDRPNEISGHWYDHWSDGTWIGTTPDGRRFWYYGAFGEFMPDLNWDNTAVRQEFEGIIQFWLGDVGLDGFRLDATKHIYEFGEYIGDTDKNIAFWTWFAETCRKYNPNAYMVGECLDGPDTVLRYHEPGMSSFATAFANSGEGRICQAVNEAKGSFFADGVLWWTREVKNRSPYATGSPFLSNHDFDRSSNWLSVEDAQRKMAAALLLLFPGTPFMYYGEEIGIKGYKHNRDDRYVRGPMYWSHSGASDMVTNIPGGWNLGDVGGMGQPIWYNQGGVDAQLANTVPADFPGDPTQYVSLLRYYIKINNLKNKYPWIAWGVTDNEGLDADSDGRVAAYRVTDKDPQSSTYGKSVVIAHNTAWGDREGAYPYGYVKVPRARGLEAVSAWAGITEPVEYDRALDAYWIKPFSTVIFRED